MHKGTLHNPPPIEQGERPPINSPAPLPKKRSARPAIWGLVVADMEERDWVGFEKYGTRLKSNNGRDALVDMYQESLDRVVYLRQVIEERDRFKDGFEKVLDDPHMSNRERVEQLTILYAECFCGRQPEL